MNGLPARKENKIKDLIVDFLRHFKLHINEIDDLNKMRN